MTSTYIISEQPADRDAESVGASDSEIAPTRPEGTEAKPSRSSARDGFLDVLRAIALARVIIWHTFGVAILSWIVATMPIMFFVAGTLLYRSLDGRDAVAVLRKRLRRLLVPFWFFGATVLSVLSLVHLREPSADTQLSADQLVAWVVPLVNPTASTWEAGWASSPLWYLRCYLWILLLSPLLLRAWKRFGYRLLVVPAVATVLVQIAADRLAPGPNDLIWIAGDLSLYSIFVLLGFANAQGRFDGLNQRDLLEWTFVGAAGAAVAWRIFPSADGVANHSYPTLLWLGVAWLAAITLLRPWLSQLPNLPIAGTVIRWMTARAMSIYLWHSPMIVLSYAATSALGFDASPLVLLALVVAGVAVAATATGWIEDVAGGRPAQLWPGRPMFSAPPSMAWTFRKPTVRAATGGFVAATVLLGLMVQPTTSVDAGSAVAADTTTDGLGLPPAPSGRPDPSAAVSEEAAPLLPLLIGADEASLTALVDAWREEHGVSGVTIGVSMPNGERQVIVSGANDDGSEMSIDQVVPVTSITKTFTAAIILQLRDEGLLDLDDPIPALDLDPTFAHAGVITYRQLLDHSSGLAPYQESIGYNPAAALDPITAIQLAGDTPLQWEPGAVGGYSNSGFLTLGQLVEQLTGEPYEAALQRRIIEPFGLNNTELDPTPVGGWVGDSAGGLTSTVTDMMTWGEVLYRDGVVLSEQSLNEMTMIDPNLASGLGTFPVCPCVDNGAGLAATSIGHNGGSVTLQFSPSDQTVIVASFTESFWTTELSQADVYPLLAAIRAAVA